MLTIFALFCMGISVIIASGIWRQVTGTDQCSEATSSVANVLCDQKNFKIWKISYRKPVVYYAFQNTSRYREI